MASSLIEGVTIYKEMLVYLDLHSASDTRMRIAIELAASHGARHIGGTPAPLPRSTESGASGPLVFRICLKRQSSEPGSKAFIVERISPQMAGDITKLIVPI
jgi:hypothetical protein